STPFPVTFFFYCSVLLRVPHSFPTRRSSDLATARTEEAEIDRTAALAVLIARAASRLPMEPVRLVPVEPVTAEWRTHVQEDPFTDRKSTRLNSSHGSISYAVFCLKKKKKIKT